MEGSLAQSRKQLEDAAASNRELTEALQNANAAHESALSVTPRSGKIGNILKNFPKIIFPTNFFYK